MSIPDYGHSYGHNTVVKAKVASTSLAIVAGDIIVHAAVGGGEGTAQAGYVKKWESASEGVLGVALTPSAVPSSDGDLSIELMLVKHGPVFVYPATSITQAYCFQTCDIDGAQSIDFDSDTYQNAWIVEVNVDKALVYVMLLDPAIDLGATDFDFGSS
jgi:hypothetical protein